MILGFLGSGSMVQAMARGWAAATDGPGAMLFTDAGSGRARDLAAEVGGEALEGNAELATRADILVLGCKPADLDRIAPGAQGAPAVLSVLGATPIGAVQAAFPAAEVHRAMPNLAVEVNRGVICFAQESASAGAGVRELLARLGEVIVIPEAQMDAATAVMGCSPAYLDLLAESLVEAGVEAGLEPELSARMVTGTVRGTAELLADRKPGELRGAVASPGGSTEAGLEALRANGFEAAVEKAVKASLSRMKGEL